MSGTINLTRESAFAWIKQPNLNALSFVASTPRTFAASGDGAANGSTIVSSVIGSYFDSDDDLVGCVVEVVEAENAGDGEGGSPIRRMVLAYSNATTTMTIEPLPWQSKSGDNYKILTGGVYASEDTGASATAVVDAGRSEAADTWIGNASMGGPYLVPVEIGGSIAETSAYLITDSASDGTLTAALGASTVVGDLFELWQFPELMEGLPASLNMPQVENTAIVGRISASQEPFIGLRDGEIPVSLAWRGPGAARIGDPTEADTPLGAVLTATAASADETIATDTTTTSVNVSAAVTAGSMWLTAAGDVCVATTAADPFTPSPTLRTDPADGTTLYAMRTYEPASAFPYALSARIWDGKSHKITCYGCAPNISFSAERGQVAKLATPLKIADWYAVAGTRHVDPIVPSVSARAVTEVRVNINGTEFAADKISFDIGAEAMPRNALNSPNQTAGFDLARYNLTGSVTLWLDDTTIAEYQRFIRKSRSRMLIQVNTVPGDPGVLALWVNRAVYTGAERADASGIMQVTIPFSCVLDASSALPAFILGTA